MNLRHALNHVLLFQQRFCYYSLGFSFSEAAAVKALPRPYLVCQMYHFYRNKKVMEVCGYIRSEFEVLHTFHHSVNEGQKIFKVEFCIISLYAIKSNKKTILILDLKTLFRVCCFY